MARGYNFDLGDPLFLDLGARAAPPNAFVGELIMNGFEAGGDVHIIPGEESATIVADTGHGIKEQDFFECFRGFGRGKKKRGTKLNLGVGSKKFLRVQSPKGVLYTTWCEGESRARRMRIGPHESGFGPIEVSKERYFEECPITREFRRNPSGTVVEILGGDTDADGAPRGIKFDADQFLKFVNGRFLTLPKAVVVWRPHGENLYQNEADGLLKCVERISMPSTESFGVLELKYSKVHWAIRRAPEEIEADDKLRSFVKRSFEPHSLYYAWNGLVYKSWPSHHGGAKMLANWGLPGGSSRIILVVEAKGADISPLDNRYGIEGWKEEKAQEEFISNMPDNLREFAEDFLEKHSEKLSKSEEDLTKELVALYDTIENAFTGGVLPIERPITGPRKRPRHGGGGGGGGGSDDGNGRGGRKPRGRYDRMWVDDEVNEGEKVRLINGVLQINRNHPDLVRIFRLASDSPTREKHIRCHIAAQLISGATRERNRRNQDPSREILEAIIACPLAAAIYGAGDGRLKVPRLPAGR